MQAIEFTTQIKAGQTIKIPECFHSLLKNQKQVRVIVLFDEDPEPDPEMLLLKQYLEEPIEESSYEEK